MSSQLSDTGRNEFLNFLNGHSPRIFFPKIKIVIRNRRQVISQQIPNYFLNYTVIIKQITEKGINPGKLEKLMPETASKEQIVNSVENLLVKAKGRLSPADASAETGYGIDDVKDAFSRLIELYESRVTMDSDTGALAIIFRYPLRKRGKKTFREVLNTAMAAAWKVFTAIYKAAIGVVLVFYTVAFVVLLIAILLGTGSRDRDRNPVGDILGALFRAIFEGARFVAWTKAIEYASEPQGYRYKQYKPEENKFKKFIYSIYNFVFGPDRPKYDPLSDTKEAVAFIQKNNGRLSAGQIVALTGVTYEEAESRLAEYASKFKGDLNITEEGTVIAEFPRLLEKLNPELKGGKIEFYIDEVDPPYQLTGNSTGRNVAIACMNIFNLVMSFVAIDYFTNFFEATALVYIFGYFAVIFSTLFFLIPIVRIPVVASLKKKWEGGVIRKMLVSAFISSPDEEKTISALMQKGRIPPDKEPSARKVMEEIVIELQGELKLNPDGAPVYTFPRLSRELLI